MSNYLPIHSWEFEGNQYRVLFDWFDFIHRCSFHSRWSWCHQFFFIFLYRLIKLIQFVLQSVITLKCFFNWITCFKPIIYLRSLVLDNVNDELFRNNALISVYYRLLIFHSNAPFIHLVIKTSKPNIKYEASTNQSIPTVFLNMVWIGLNYKNKIRVRVCS